MRTLILSLVLVLGLSACGPKEPVMKPRPGVSRGDYRVTLLRIRPEDENMKKDEEYQWLRQQLTQRLPQKLARHQQGMPVGMTVTINDVSMEINVARNWLVGDSYRVSSEVELWDASTEEPLLQEPMKSSVAHQYNPFGLLGALAEEAFADTKAKANQAVGLYVNDLMHKLYPKHYPGEA